MKRRTFIKTASLLTAGAAFLPYCSRAKKQKQIGLQLYTVRDDIAKDLEGTLQKVAEIGYNIVEGAGYSNRLFYGKKPAEFKALLNGMGLTMPSTHAVTELTTEGDKSTIMDTWGKTVEDSAAAGVHYVVFAYLPAEERKSLDNYKAIAEKFNRFGEICNETGLQFAYHNHDFEFINFDGTLPYDLLLNETDENLVKMQIDTYWIIKAGYDPVDYFEKYPGRFELWHLKDMEDSEEKSFVEVGHGTIDFRRIFQYNETAGMKLFFVEQDTCKRLPLESIKMSYDYLNNADFI